MNANFIFTGWHLMRWLRLVIGAVMLYQGFGTEDNISIFLGIFLLVQAVTNTGCCATSCTSSPSSHSFKNDKEEPSFEIIHSK